jgi:hypothetical protein
MLFLVYSPNIASHGFIALTEAEVVKRRAGVVKERGKVKNFFMVALVIMWRGSKGLGCKGQKSK